MDIGFECKELIFKTGIEEERPIDKKKCYEHSSVVKIVVKIFLYTKLIRIYRHFTDTILGFSGHP